MPDNSTDGQVEPSDDWARGLTIFNPRDDLDKERSIGKTTCKLPEGSFRMVKCKTRVRTHLFFRLTSP